MGSLDGASAEYPRVIIVRREKVSELDNSGASLGKWFSAWPREKLAQIWSNGPANLPSKICAQEYHIGDKEHHFRGLYRRIKKATAEAVPDDAVGTNAEVVWRLRRLRVVLSSTVHWFLDSGLWEMPFRAKVSKELMRWLRTFQPEVIYANPTDIYYMDLSLQLAKQTSLPLCLEIEDDSPGTLYRHSPMCFLLRPWIERKFQSLVKRASAHCANNYAMAAEYGRRYGVKWNPILNADSFARFDKTIPETLTPSGVWHLVYCGSLYLDRWRAIADIARAAGELATEGLAVQLEVFTSRLPTEAALAFEDFRNIAVHPMPSDDRVPGVLKGADLLLLPEWFDARIAEYIRYSVSAKSHLYMMSQRPILVYGPAGTGSVEYARNFGWAYVVDHCGDLAGIKQGIRKLLLDDECVSALLGRARNCAMENHDVVKVRRNFERLLVGCREVGVPAGG